MTPDDALVRAGGAAEVVRVLCQVQVAFLVLAGFGEVLLMGGNPLYLGLPLAKSVLLLVVAAAVVRHRRWALITMIVLQGLTLFGFEAQVALALVPALAFTANLVGLTTNLVLPAVVLVLCGQILARRAPARPAYPPAQDPYLPAPLVTSATGTVVLPVAVSAGEDRP